MLKNVKNMKIKAKKGIEIHFLKRTIPTSGIKNPVNS